MPDTFGYPQQTPQSPSTGLFHDRERPIRRPLAHRLDEFPAGYSSADCSPAGSASASPTVDHFALMSSRRSILFCRTVNSVLTVCLSSGDQPRCWLTASPPAQAASPCFVDVCLARGGGARAKILRFPPLDSAYRSRNPKRDQQLLRPRSWLSRIPRR